MADLTLDDENLSNGTNPGGPDFDTFEVVFSGFFSSDPNFEAGFQSIVGLSGGLYWTLDSSSGRITGYDPDGTAVVLLEIVDVGLPTPSGIESEEVRVTVQATLLDNYRLHPLDGDDLAQLGSVTVFLSENSSEYYSTRDVSLEVSDDVAVADDDFAFVVNGMAAGNVLVNDVIGADECPPPRGPVVSFVPSGDAGPVEAVRSENGQFVAVPATGAVTISGQYGVLTINSDGQWEYTATSPDPGRDTFEYRIRDCEYSRSGGDPSIARLVIETPDNEPSANPVVVALDDEALPGGNPGGPGDDPSGPSPFTGFLAGLGGDGPLVYSIGATGAPAGFTYTETAPGVIEIAQDGVVVLTVTLVSAQTGEFRVVQIAPIVNDAGQGENNQLLPLVYSVIDRDGDVARSEILIDVDDDSPFAGTATVRLDDDSLPGGIAGGPGDDAGPIGTSGTLPGSVGADTPGSFALSSAGAPAGFTYDTTTENTLVILQGSTRVITVTLTDAATGAYTVTQDAPIDHRVSGTEDNQQFTISYLVRDADGDTANGAMLIDVDDDSPAIANATIRLDDETLAGGNPGGPGDDAISGASGTLAPRFGADGPGEIGFSSAGAPAGFSYDTATENTLIILQGATRIATVQITDSDTGAFTVTQNAPVDHTVAGTEDNVVFTISYTATDRDGDVAAGTITIDIDDDSPIAADDSAELVDGEGGSLVVDVSDNDSVGADGPGTLSFEGGTYGTVTVAADGTQTYTLNALGRQTIADLADGETVSDTIGYTLTDADGDTTEADLVLTLVGSNGPPQFTQDEFVFLIWDENQAFDVTANDPDDDPIDYAVVPPGPQFGNVSGGQGGAFSYVPTTTTPVVDGLGVTAGDPDGLTTQAGVTLLVALEPPRLDPLAGLDFSMF